MQNGYIESFNGKFRDECLNENWFVSLSDARQIIEQWRRHYNQERPHSALGYRTPEEFAAEVKSFDRDGVGQGTSMECTPRMRHQIKGPATLNGGELCWCPDNSIPVN